MIVSKLKTITTASVTSLMLLATPMLGVVSTTAVAKTANSEQSAMRLNKLLKNLNSMTANFTQTTKGGKSQKGKLAKNRSFSGSMMVKRPNNLRWETKSPSEQLIVVKNQQMWIYDKDLEQVTKQSTRNELGNTPALLLSGNYQNISKNFRVSQPNAKKHYYRLYPKTKTSNLKYMGVLFQRGTPKMMVIKDSLGQETAIRFSNVKVNPYISNSKFNFKAPKGVDVISQ